LGRSDLHIRQASIEDAAPLAELVSALGYPTTPIEMKERLAALTTRQDYATPVACWDDKIVGLAGAFLHLAIEHNRPVARLTGLVVHEDWQGRGVGTLLMQHLEEWAQQRGAVTITLTSANHRHGAHEFYRHIGYDQTGVRFTKRLA
jgi:GNAT superfamily N-acetyltransferase